MRILPALITNSGSVKRIENKAFYFKYLASSELAQQPQHEQHDQNHPAKAQAGMAHPVAVPSEPAAKAAYQVNDHDDDQDQPKGHGTLPERRPARETPP